jgi:ADP-ribose pyrophosphatase
LNAQAKLFLCLGVFLYLEIKMKFTVLSSEEVFRGRAFSIQRDQLRTPDGRTTHFDIIGHYGSVVILPVDSDGNILFVRQYRHATKTDLLELPAGTLDSPDELPLHCAEREIREETGYEAKKFVELGKFFLVPGYSTEEMTVFLATDLHENPLEPDADEFLQMEKIPLEEAFSMAVSSKIPDAKTLAALLMARPHLEKYFSS